MAIRRGHGADGFRRARTAVDSERTPQDRWLVSYADFITLLFAFFTTMYAIAIVDPGRLGMVGEALQVAFAAPPDVAPPVDPPVAPPPAAVPPPKVVDSVDALGEDLEHVRHELAERLATHIASEQVALEVDRRGLVVSIREAGSFATGSAELSTSARALFAQAGVTIARIGNFVRVEGHTDDVPIRTSRYHSNWELSTARATNVVDFMVTELRIDPKRLSAAGYSEFHPRLPNDTVDGRARNRRVDLVILNPATRGAEERGVS